MSDVEDGGRRGRTAGWFLLIGALGCAVLALSSGIAHEWVQMVFEVICSVGVLYVALWSFGLVNALRGHRRNGQSAP